MKMDLKFAASHSRETAERKQSEGCLECADEHFQLADWLEELAAYRATGISASDIQEAVDMFNGAVRPSDLPKELKSWVERCTWHVKKCGELHRDASALSAELVAAKTDIAALLWLDGRCQYCKSAKKVEYSGVARWECGLGGGVECRPEWKGGGTPWSMSGSA